MLLKTYIWPKEEKKKKEKKKKNGGIKKIIIKKQIYTTGQDKALTSSHENQKKIINTILLHVNLHMWKSNYGASIICDHIKKKKQLSKLNWNNKWDRYSWFCLFNYLLHYTYSWLGGLLIAQPAGWACQWMGKAVWYGRVWSAYI